MGGRRWMGMALVAIAVFATLTFGFVVLRSADGEADGDTGSTPSSAQEGPASQEASDRTAAPSPGGATSSYSGDSPSSGGGVGSGQEPESAAPPTSVGGTNSPPSPPPQPPPSPPVQPRPIPCTVAVYAGPIPGVPNIRIVVTAAPNVDVLWATVTERGRSLRGSIALAGGRGEQIVDGVSPRARVTVFSDPSMAEPTQSCSTP